MDIVDNCDHRGEQIGMVQYFSASILDEELPVQQIRRCQTIGEVTNESILEQIKVSGYQTTLFESGSASKKNEQQIRFKSPLEQYQEMKNKKVDYLMRFEECGQLNEQLVRKGFGKSRCLCSDGEGGRVVVGSSLGNVAVYDNNGECRQLQCERGMGSVCCMDMQDDRCVVGYENGSIGLIDVVNVRWMKMCREVHKCRVLSIGMILNKKGKYVSSVSGDENGVSRIVHLRDSLLGMDYMLQLVVPKQQFPWISLKCCRHLYKKGGSIVAMLSLQRLLIIRTFKDIDKKIQILLSIDNPDHSNALYASIAWGQGRLPSPSLQQQLRWDQTQTILLLSYNTHVYPIIYHPQSDDDPFYIMKPLLLIKDQVHNLSFLSTNVIQITTSSQVMYLINTIHITTHITPKSIKSIQHLIYQNIWKYNVFTTLYFITYNNNTNHRTQSINHNNNHNNSQQIDRTQSQQEVYPLQSQSFGNNMMAHGVWLLIENGVQSAILNEWERTVQILMQNGDWASAMWVIITVMDGSVKYSREQKMPDEQQLRKMVKEVTTGYLNIILKQMKFVLDKYKSLELNVDNKSVNLVHSTLSLLIDFLLRTYPTLLLNQTYNILKGFLKGNICIFAQELSNYTKTLHSIVAPTDVICTLLQQQQVILYIR